MILKIEKYNCDWCRKDFDVSEMCVGIQFGFLFYDLCNVCRDAAFEKLGGRGSKAVDVYHGMKPERPSNGLDSISDGYHWTRAILSQVDNEIGNGFSNAPYISTC